MICSSVQPIRGNTQIWVVIRRQVASCFQSNVVCVRKYLPRRVIYIILYFDSEILEGDGLAAALPGGGFELFQIFLPCAQ